MAQRRMFSLRIVDSDAFLDMPQSSQLLYFHLGMNADDDGFVNPKKIMRVIGSQDDDIKVLIAKRFILPFENGVVVIKHWLINNLIRKDFYQETAYLEQKNMLQIKDNKAYTEVCKQNVNNLDTQVRLGKVRLGKLPEQDSSENKKKTLKKNSFRYNETNPSDTFEDVVSLDTGELETEGRGILPQYKEMVRWAEDRRGFPFLRPLTKQYKAFKIARTNKIEPERLTQRWKEFENNKLYKETGFDWMTVVMSFSRKQ